MQMIGINALIDVASRYEGWTNRQLIVLVLNNRDLNQVTWEQRVLAGDPKLDASQVIPDFPYARYAELVGLRGPPGRRPGSGGRRVGRGARRGPAGGLRGRDRSGGAAA